MDSNNNRIIARPLSIDSDDDRDSDTIVTSRDQGINPRVNTTVLDVIYHTLLRPCCWFTKPDHQWDASWYISARGGESFHLYVWVAKDICWTQNWYIAGHVFGLLAVVWSIILIAHGIVNKNLYEFWIATAQCCWLIANLWWMSSELHDYHFPNEPKLYPQHTIESGDIIWFALIWLAAFYVIIRPCAICIPSALSMSLYNEATLRSRVTSLFQTWRDYEHVHIVFWIAKDYCWNRNHRILWLCCVSLALAVAFDFYFSTLFKKKLLIEHVHYSAQMFWVSGNAMWAVGELFFPNNDQPYPYFSSDPNRLKTLRWYSSWCLACAYAPPLILHVIWWWHSLCSSYSTTTDKSYDSGERQSLVSRNLEASRNTSTTQISDSSSQSPLGETDAAGYTTKMLAESTKNRFHSDYGSSDYVASQPAVVINIEI